MSFFLKTVLLTAALGLSACASMGEAHRHGMGQGPTATQEAGEQDMQRPMMGMMTPLVGCHGAHGDAEARLASLRTALSITPSQAAAWHAYAEAYRANAARMSGMMSMMESRTQGSAPSSVPERLRHHETMMSQHLASLQALRAAIDTLYAALSDEQKAAADALRCERQE